MYPRKTARVHSLRGSCYFTTGFGSTSAGFFQLSGLNPGRVILGGHGFGLDQTLRKKTGLFPK